MLFLIDEARKRGLGRLSLETGAGDRWVPARKMYESLGFEVCEAYGSYKEDNWSVFMTRVL